MAAFVATSPIQRGTKRSTRKAGGAQLAKTAPKFVMEGFLTKVWPLAAPRRSILAIAPSVY